HGGVAASKELCRYAARRGVRILPGVGTSGYAGYYFEGKHPFNAKEWLTERPHLRSVGRDGKPRSAPCPSKKENQDWLDRGAEWLFENFEVGGVNLEMGDFFVCYCDDCKKARAEIKSSEPDYYKDMAISHMVTLKTMRRLAPESWLSYATYTGYKTEMMKTPPKFLSMIPEDSLCQWTLTRMAHRWRPEVKPMARHNVGYLHWCNSSTHTEDDFYIERVRDICGKAAAAGFEGLDTYGELPDTKINAEISYLAWEAFLWQPEMTLDEFAEKRLGRIYGGAEAGKALLEIVPLIRTRKMRDEPANLLKARKLAAAARKVASADGHRRWNSLIENLDRTHKTLEDRRLGTAARKGRKVPVLSLSASDEDPKRGWAADRAIDGNVKEPEGYWLTQRVDPKAAWLELTLVRPEKINRVALFHQLNSRHYRSLDYTVSVRAGGKWKPVVEVKGNMQAGWVGHKFAAVTTDAVRLDISRSAYGSRMGVGEIEVRMEEE
ncbi:MAG: discoidin domain-containing protein, partial [Pirellulales bacterium]|nr:discoidin domain-containing protein [Pirellulales bacterium]